MKSLLIAMGLAVALTVGAQTATDEQQQSQQKEKNKTEENVQPGRTKENVQKQNVQPAERARTQTKVEKDVNKPEGAKVRSEEKVRGDEQHSGARVDERGEVSHSTTVFRDGRETHESLALHRGFRDRSDVHFGIGTHPRDWWLRTYSIVVMDGCHYYLADNGCWYPAYGFDPSCNYTDGVVYCE
jgi:glucose/arabinose dehydrogenase